jgi:hypothetical protein
MTEIGLALLVLASIPPLSLGYAAGTGVKVALWVWANVRIGYYRGRGLEIPS